MPRKATPPTEQMLNLYFSLSVEERGTVLSTLNILHKRFGSEEVISEAHPEDIASGQAIGPTSPTRKRRRRKRTTETTATEAPTTYGDQELPGVEDVGQP